MLSRCRGLKRWLCSRCRGSELLRFIRGGGAKQVQRCRRECRSAGGQSYRVAELQSCRGSEVIVQVHQRICRVSAEEVQRHCRGGAEQVLTRPASIATPSTTDPTTCPSTTTTAAPTAAAPAASSLTAAASHTNTAALYAPTAPPPTAVLLPQLCHLYYCSCSYCCSSSTAAPTADCHCQLPIIVLCTSTAALLLV